MTLDAVARAPERKPDVRARRPCLSSAAPSGARRRSSRTAWPCVRTAETVSFMTALLRLSSGIERRRIQIFPFQPLGDGMQGPGRDPEVPEAGPCRP
ncbi:hypothetical protein LP419_35465 [Massilia sp. H-1]|nr:hypothetical protein LP419_35465 [Massilia sp. H-1]